MTCHDFHVGDPVFVFSEILNEIILGTVEGFEGEQRERVKVLQSLQEGYLRHIVSWVNVFNDEESAREVQRDYLLHMKDKSNHYPEGIPDRVYYAGMTVHLRRSGDLVCDEEGNPYNYQITKVFRNRQKVSLVNIYGESIGVFRYDEIVFSSLDPLFKSEDYFIGQSVRWIEGNDVYEGIITQLNETSAELSDIRKLMPWDYKKSVPYYKLSGEDSSEKPNTMILTSIVGDNLDQE